ncbi:MAG: PCRF domain-containing protein, partial [Candidatus Pacebacteria bacterium]|nr:PCRF domain-containing protein [Candidatus Paceibacterota bacterium]
MTSPYQDQIDQLEVKIQENRNLADDPDLKELALLEIENLEEQKKLLTQAADQMQAAQSQNSAGPITKHKNAILEFRQGAGGDEAKIWAEELQRMYTRFAEKLNFKVEFIDDQIIKIKGQTQL